MHPETPGREPLRPTCAAQTSGASRLQPGQPPCTSRPPNPALARGALRLPGCAGDPREEEWSAGNPAALPCRSDAASASHTERRMLGPGAAAGRRAPRLGCQPGLCLQPRNRLSGLGSLAFKEPSARPRPACPRASPRDEPRPRPPPQAAARAGSSPACGSAAAWGTAASGVSGRCTPPRLRVQGAIPPHRASGHAGRCQRPGPASPSVLCSQLASYCSQKLCRGLGQLWDPVLHSPPSSTPAAR